MTKKEKHFLRNKSYVVIGSGGKSSDLPRSHPKKESSRGTPLAAPATPPPFKVRRRSLTAPWQLSAHGRRFPTSRHADDGMLACSLARPKSSRRTLTGEPDARCPENGETLRLRNQDLLPCHGRKYRPPPGHHAICTEDNQRHCNSP